MAATSLDVNGKAEFTRGTMPSACDQCYRCKVRCSGGRPSCDRCKRAGSSCTYSFGEQGRRTKRKSLRSKTAAAPGCPPAKKRKASTSDAALEITHSASEDGAILEEIYGLTGVPGEGPTATSNVVYDGSNSLDGPTSSAVTIALPDLSSFSTFIQDAEQDDWTSLAPFSWSPAHRGSASSSDSSWLSQEWPLGIPDIETEILSSPPYPGDFERMPALQPEGMDEFNQFLLQQENALTAQKSSDGSQLLTESIPAVDCSCDPAALELIPRLYKLNAQAQVNGVALDSALSMARNGLETISTHISCHACYGRQRPDAVKPLFAVFQSALRLILHQVLMCYRTIEESWMDPAKSVLPSIKVAETSITEAAAGRQILKAVVSSELVKAKELALHLERFTAR